MIDEIFVNVKSTPLDEESVEQLIASLPVKVYVIVADVEFVDVAASVSVGGVLSTTTGV